MVESTDAILPVLKKIRDSLADIRYEQQLAKERQIEITDAVMEVQDVVSETRQDNLLHLGLTTRHRLDFEALKRELADVKTRIEMLESRS